MTIQPSISVLVTGCSSGGIGHALAKRYQQEGLTVFASARTISKMGDLATMPHVRLIGLDVTDLASIQAAVTVVEKATGGRLNYLVNNAGIFTSTPLLDVPLVNAKGLFDTNLWDSK